MRLERLARRSRERYLDKGKGRSERWEQSERLPPSNFAMAAARQHFLLPLLGIGKAGRQTCKSRHNGGREAEKGARKYLTSPQVPGCLSGTLGRNSNTGGRNSVRNT